MEPDNPLPPDINRGRQILSITGTFTIVALLTVIVRIWVRVKIVKLMGAEDWVMIAAMTVMITEMGIIIPEVALGAGRHWQYIQPPSNITKGLFLNFLTQPLCLVALCLAKVSVGLFLLRLATTKKFKRFLIGWIAITVAAFLANLLTVFFQCHPLALTWDHSIEGKCLPSLNLRTAALVNSSVAAATDVIFALLPVPMLWKVKLDIRAKIAVMGILSLGFFVSAAAIVKITFLPSYGKYGDFLYDSSDLTIWTTVEICTAIIAASIPCLKPLTKMSFGSRASSQQSDPNTRTPYYQKRDNLLNTGISSTQRSKGSQATEQEDLDLAADNEGLERGCDPGRLEKRDGDIAFMACNDPSQSSVAEDRQ